MNPTTVIFALLGGYALWMGLRARAASDASAPQAVWVAYPVTATQPERERVRRARPGEPWPTLAAPSPNAGPGVVLGEGGGVWT